MSAREINFDGLIGPSHNYAGLALGNVASADNQGQTSRPRDAALQGLAKMRRVFNLGLIQGFLPPPRRPAVSFLRGVGYRGSDRDVLSAAAAEDRALLAAASSASAMWAANAATVIAAPDSLDGRVHLIAANLSSHLHRSIEGPETYQTLRRVFRDEAVFAVHPPLPHGRQFGDEGAANHMRLAHSHDQPGVNVFVHGREGSARYPARQAQRASEAVARLGGVSEALHIEQSPEAISAGAFHNDVVAVANECVLLAHRNAFEDRDALLETLQGRVQGMELLEINAFGLDDAVRSYVFNSQLVTLPKGGMALIIPFESRTMPTVWAEIGKVAARSQHIREIVVVDVRESMRNGGGPACLRLRVPVSDQALAGVDARFLLDQKRIDRLERLVEARWPKTLSPDDLAYAEAWESFGQAGDDLEDLLVSDDW
jgi:succinylarginine dihydrolase